MKGEPMTSRSKAKPRAGSYLVLASTSTRVSLDRRSPGYRDWIHYRPGDVVTAWPDHAPVEEWVASGHWKEQA